MSRLDIEIKNNSIKVSWNKSNNKKCNKYNVLLGNNTIAKKIGKNSFSFNKNEIYCKDIGVQVVDNHNQVGNIVYGRGNYNLKTNLVLKLNKFDL